MRASLICFNFHIIISWNHLCYLEITVFKHFSPNTVLNNFTLLGFQVFFFSDITAWEDNKITPQHLKHVICIMCSALDEHVYKHITSEVTTCGLQNWLSSGQITVWINWMAPMLCLWKCDSVILCFVSVIFLSQAATFMCCVTSRIRRVWHMLLSGVLFQLLSK